MTEQENKKAKIVFIGAGMVGVSGIYSVIHKSLASEIIIIDINTEVIQGHALDLRDALGDSGTLLRVGEYSDCQDADIIVVSAGRPQKDGETRLDMLQDNVKIITFIAESVKKSGFTGVSLIVSNPVDIMATIYREVSGLEASKVISSGCVLDTQRLKGEIADMMQIHISDIMATVIGEHGDSSVSVIYAPAVSQEQKKIFEKRVQQKAYDIIRKKGATYFGIGMIISQILESIINDQHKVFPVGKLLNGEYERGGVYASLPCVIGRQGIVSVEKISLIAQEIEHFQASVDTLTGELKKILK